MQILQIVTFRTLKDESDGVVFDRVLQVLLESGYDPERIRFRFEDHPEYPFSKRVSAVDRAIKAYPKLAPFRGEIVQQWNNNQRLVILSNFHGSSSRPELRIPAAPCAPISTTILSEVLHGVPRRFPFWHTMAIFDNVDALSTPEISVASPNKTLDLHDLSGPGVILGSGWWTSGRLKELEAIISIPVPVNDAPLELNPATQKLINSVGKVVHAQLKIIPAPSECAQVEAQSAEAKRVTEKYRNNPFANSPDTTLPYALPTPRDAFGVPLIARREEGIPSVKELLQQEFKPMGYRYRSALSGQGCYSLQKRGPQNYIFWISIDVSPIGGQFCASFGVSTPHGSLSVPLQLPPFGRDYPVDENLPAVVKNTAFVVQKLEETYVAELESIFGPAPRWFAEANACK